MSERPEAVAADGLPERKVSFASRAFGIARRAPLLALPVAAIVGVVCSSSEEVAQSPSPAPTPESTGSPTLVDCPEGIYGTSSNSVIVRSRGEEFDEEVLAIFEKYGACRDTLPEHLYPLDGGRVISRPYVLSETEEMEERREEFLRDLQKLVGKGKLEGVEINSGLQSLR